MRSSERRALRYIFYKTKLKSSQEELLENTAIDENALKPEGTVTAIREGGPLPNLSNIPHSVEAAIHRYVPFANSFCPEVFFRFLRLFVRNTSVSASFESVRGRKLLLGPEPRP